VLGVEARALAARQAEERPGFRAYAMCADLAMEDLQRAIGARDAADLKTSAEDALRWVRLAIEAQPASARRRADLGDALVAAGDARGAAAAYEAALAQDDRTSLDPLMQFSTRERTRIRSALERARTATDAATP
jgi:lipopolysaccharide biosynthesis regulator YciM